MTIFNLNLAALKVLVIDDSATVRSFLRKMLLDLGVSTIAVAEDGADAIEKLSQFPADVAICDLHMTPVDGIEFTRLLRNADDSPNPYLPLLMLTGDATAAQLKNAMAAGVHSFMSKPVDKETMRRNLSALFAHPLVFIKDERSLRPVLPKGLCEAKARSRSPDAPQPAKAFPAAPQPAQQSL